MTEYASRYASTRARWDAEVCYCLVCLSHCFQGQLLQVPTASSHTEPIRGLWIGRSSSPPKDTQSTTAWHGSAPQHCCHSLCAEPLHMLCTTEEIPTFFPCAAAQENLWGGVPLIRVEPNMLFLAGYGQSQNVLSPHHCSRNLPG